jgi:hypothetical protein
MKKRGFEAKALAPGQVWQVADARLQIAEVGKTLVHYKRYKLAPRGVPTSLAAIRELTKYLRDKKALLVQE